MSFEHRLNNASLSTMWALNNHPDLSAFIELSRQLGFQSVELNHQIDLTMLSQVNLSDYQFSSVHEPCPADISTKELVFHDWLISSIDELSRRKGVDSIKKSINLAHELSAPAVIIHCGTIPSQLNVESKLRALFKAGKSETVEYLEIKTQLIEYRKKFIDQRFQSVKTSLLELIEFAGQANVKLGLENRYHFLDIPSIDEMDELLSLADPAHLGFIYDVGHAQALDRLGFYPHQEWLNQFSSRMFGTHLHDVIGLTDHYAPGLGEIDFNQDRPISTGNCIPYL